MNFEKGRYKTPLLGVFSLTMINVCAIQSLRNLAIMAETGWASIFFYLLSALLFFIPAALVAAELAGAFPSAGGVYTWVKEAFGPRWGFAAIFLQWAENVIWYPTVLSFTAATIAYLIDPALADNYQFIIAMILLIFWGSTLFDAFGMRVAGLISTVGVIGGTLIPAAVIIFLGSWWVISGLPIQLSYSPRALFPDLNDWSNLVFLTGVMLSFGGIEMAAVHAKDVQNPRRNYPKAIFLSTAIILLLSISGSLAIAAVVPKKSLSLVAGVMQAFEIFFTKAGLPFLIPVFAIMIALGSIAMVATWIVGPSRGLLFAAEQGDLPAVFQKKNRWEMPTVILGIQGALVALLSFAFVLMPTVSASFWALTALTAILYLFMYILLFLAAIRLRFSKKDTPRIYRIPGGNIGMFAVAGVGLISSVFAIVIGFVPPPELNKEQANVFTWFLFGGAGAIFLLPHMLFRKG